MPARPVVHATPSIALVGRKNVGKSSLFNRLIERKQAIVSNIPGTTRDVGIGTCLWRGQLLTILDTGGLDIVKRDEIEVNVRKQALRAAQKSHLIVFVVDAQTGPLSTDLLLAKELRKVGPPVILAVNKSDNPNLRVGVSDEWRKLGFGEPVAVSAVNGGGSGDLLDRVFEELKKIELPLEKVEPELIITMLGRPNVGKSSLLNAMIGEERVIVSEIPHTTREPQDTLLFYGGRPILIVDTAGIRKRAKIGPGLEMVSVEKSMVALKQTDVALLILDVTDDVSSQDSHLAGLADDSGKGIIVVLNKWDLVGGKTEKTSNDFKERYQKALPFLAWAPIVFTSAISGQRVQNLLDLALKVRENRERVVSEDELDEFIDEVIKPYVKKRTPHRKDALGTKKKHPHIYGLRQTATAPPTFSLIVKDKAVVDFSYLRFIENRMRDRFEFEGTPLRVHAREIQK
jgi:GTP-binding protein